MVCVAHRLSNLASADLSKSQPCQDLRGLKRFVAECKSPRKEFTDLSVAVPSASAVFPFRRFGIARAHSIMCPAFRTPFRKCRFPCQKRKVKKES